MTTDRSESGSCTLTLTDEERTQLLSWLEERLRNTLVVEHRTENIDYRKHVLHEEAILNSLIEKLRKA